MKCEDPILCYDNGKRRMFRHFSLANPIFRIQHNKVFNCGTCIFCRKRKAQELAIRCVLHASLYDNNCFLTLTYDETKPGYHNELSYRDIQLFKKSLRQHVWRRYKKRIQIFNVHEYGKNGKKHWHLVVFNHDFSDKELFTIKNGNRLYTSKKLAELWPHGFNTIGDVTEASAMYQAQYTQKDLKNGHQETHKRAKSNHSGIGRDYFLKHYHQILTLGFIPFNNRKIPVPRYFHKIAYKHFSHYYAPENFEDTSLRKKLFNRFKPGVANLEIANLFLQYERRRKEQIDELSDKWLDDISDYIYEGKPDFVKSAENYKYDLKNRNNNNEF